jgi:protoporphyrin/coproporphyrin ferrochelatase
LPPNGESSRDGVLLVAHGTVDNLDDLPAFLSRIRHGRPCPPELVAEVRRRYKAIGRSPLLDQTREQASKLAGRLQLPVFIGMRLWEPSIEQALQQAFDAGVQRLCVLPLAPFSVHVYVRAVEACARVLRERGKPAPDLIPAPAWGEHPAFVGAHADLILRHAPSKAALVLSAHSLPSQAIAAGDPYAALVLATAKAIGEQAGRSYRVAYQSQGADGGAWLSPDLHLVLRQLAGEGVDEVVLAPVGFLTEHVETLYDLDVEAAGWAGQLGLKLTRLPAIGAHPGLIEALADVVRTALAAR